MLPCRRAPKVSTFVDFRLYSKVSRGGKPFLTTKGSVHIHSKIHIFFYAAVPVSLLAAVKKALKQATRPSVTSVLTAPKGVSPFTRFRTLND